MRNILLLLTGILIFTINLSGQTILFEENFDAYNAGDKLVQATGDQTTWDTWSSLPGGSEDPVISSNFSNSPDNSLYIANNNDVVFLANDRTEGRYKMAFKLLIETGRIGYFNMLQNFAGSSSEWAFQVYFNANGEGTVDAGTSEAASFSYEYNNWNDVITIIDLDDDFATLYINGVEIISWKWSLGSFGAGTMTKLDAVNFYGNNTGGSSGMYIDDLVFTEEIVPESPQNLTATVVEEKTIELNWDAPAETPDNYVLTRNSQVIANDITDNYFSEAPYPGDNTYTVRAHTIGSGYSHSSNEAMGTIPGGLDRDWVLFEIGTGTGCQFCPGSAMGAVDMVDNGDNVIIVKYHNYNSSDPFNTAASAERAGNYYNISGYPTSFADGTLSLVGGSTTESLFDSYHQHYEQRMTRKALYSLDVNVFHLSGNDYRAEITVNQHSDYISEQKTLHTALTESDIDYAWQNQDQVHWSCRNMFPDAFGTKVDFNGESEQSMNLDFSMEDDWVKENCEFVVFLQADPSKEVMVTTKVDMADVLLNEISIAQKSLEIYPNPTSDFVNFKHSLNESYRLLDVSGKMVMNGQTGNRIDLSQLEKGMYFLEVEGYQPKKILVK